MTVLRFQSFGSGSSGNCYFIGTSEDGILIDAGIGVRNIKRNLRDLGLGFENILGVFVTHDHADHVKSVGILGERHNVPVYATSLVHKGIDANYRVTVKLGGSKRILEKFENISLNGYNISSFPVSHDSTDSVGYSVEYNNVKMVFATDLGEVTQDLANQIVDADHLLLEANYDHEMLLTGAYPPHLKVRINSPKGHLSNEQAGQFLSENYSKKWKSVFLCHLSKENNRPDRAFSTVKNYLEQKNVKIGEDLRLQTLDRIMVSQVFELK